ncbi:hypothetical protein [Lysobacter auxotrophicus]|uniref:Uncharacterized protein n=1 Tax=Lysobacter auxotrophicus TaxID=2992573 RepID=A0ABM8DB47_9GAMM|nr:hypothetical protein [Lysobacter auxotrophicus]BDU15806.1 hypothetical protein LA521A_10070 [Lysobacter auxotrophicus]
MNKVLMAVSMLLVSAAASAHSGSQLKVEGARSQGAEHSVVRFDAAQTVAFAGKKKPAAKAEEPKAAEPAKEETANLDPNTYKPKTQFDNTPYRFNMHQNGKKMTADEFDAWMKSRGFRVAKGNGGGAAAAGAAPAGKEVAAEAKAK